MGAQVAGEEQGIKFAAVGISYDSSGTKGRHGS